MPLTACGVGSREYLNERLSRDSEVCVGNKRAKGEDTVRAFGSVLWSEK